MFVIRMQCIESIWIELATCIKLIITSHEFHAYFFGLEYHVLQLYFFFFMVEIKGIES